jgi:hypothetical protein
VECGSLINNTSKVYVEVSHYISGEIVMTTYCGWVSFVVTTKLPKMQQRSCHSCQTLVVVLLEEEEGPNEQLQEVNKESGFVS